MGAVPIKAFATNVSANTIIQSYMLSMNWPHVIISSGEVSVAKKKTKKEKKTHAHKIILKSKEYHAPTGLLQVFRSCTP